MIAFAKCPTACTAVRDLGAGAALVELLRAARVGDLLHASVGEALTALGLLDDGTPRVREREKEAGGEGKGRE